IRSRIASPICHFQAFRRLVPEKHCCRDIRRSADARAARPRSGYCRRSAGGTRRDPIHGPGAHALAGAAQFYDVSPELVWRAGAVFGWCWNYGVIAYAVSQRTREIGVRMAMGAQPGQVQTMVLGEGLKLVLTGLLFGVAAALMLMRLLEGLVYGVGMHDPLVFISVNLVMLFVALVACYVPARRAARVDPLVALRYE